MSNGDIDSEFFDTDKLQSEVFLGRIVESDIREGTVGKLVGETVWYLEIENISREMTFNFSKELVPSHGKNSLWTRELVAFKNIGITINKKVIRELKGRYFWFMVHDITFKDREGNERVITRNFFEPVGIPSEEEVNKVLAKRGLATELEEEETLPWEEEKPVEKQPEQESQPQNIGIPESIEPLVMSLIDGKTHEEFMEDAKTFDELKDYLEVLRNKTAIAELIVKKKLGIKNNRYYLKETP